MKSFITSEMKNDNWHFAAAINYSGDQDELEWQAYLKRGEETQLQTIAAMFLWFFKKSQSPGTLALLFSLPPWHFI